MIEFLFKVLGLTSFVKWISPAFEDDKGLASFRRITPFVLTGTCVYMIVADKLPTTDRKFAFTSMLIGAAFYAGLITFQNVFSIYQMWKGGNQNLPELGQDEVKQVSLTGTLSSADTTAQTTTKE